MSLPLKSKAEPVKRLKNKALVLAALGYGIFLNWGLDTGLGVIFLTPNYCWAALGCAVAAACIAKQWQWLWAIAGVVAIAGWIFADLQNRKWPAQLEQLQARSAAPPPTQTSTNR